MNSSKNVRSLLALAACTLLAEPALAHFKLMKPTSWLKEDPAAVGGGGPQKGGPCGPGGYDDVQPIPTSGAVTEFHAGETIEVDWVDTIAHPGHFRIALAQNRADLKNPDIVQDPSCNYDESMVPRTASGNVLADGVFFRSRVGFDDAAGKMFTTQVTLPNQPCDKCTLQVMQIMESDIKALSNCYYFHCADVRILAPGQASSAGGTTGQGTGGDPSTSSGGGGLVGGLGTGGAFGFGGTPGQSGTPGLPPPGTGLGGMLGTGGMGLSTALPGTGTGGLLGIAGVTAGVAAAPGSAVGGTGATGAAPASAPSQNEGCALGAKRGGSTTSAAALLMLAMLAWTRRHRW